MASGEKFDYEQFRRQAVVQLRTSSISMAFLRSLLAPVIHDLLELALQEDDQSMASVDETDKSVEAVMTETDLDQPIEIQSITPVLARPALADRSIEQPTIFGLQADHFVNENFYEGVPYQSLRRQLNWQGWPVSMTVLMRITDQGLPRVEAWHKRPLHPIYTFMWVASLPFQFWHSTHSSNRSVYVVTTIDLQGRRDIIGYYAGAHDLASTWITIVSDLQERGVEDILIACAEEPTSLKEAFRESYPQTQVHGCVMLQMRTTLHSLIGKDKTAATKILRTLYSVTDEVQATEIWQSFRNNWTERYPMLVENWEHNWPFITGLMQYPPLVAKRAQRFTLLDTLHQAILTHLKAYGPYVNEEEFLKSTYIISQKLVSKNTWSVGNWGMLLEQLVCVFGNRLKK
ncbi:IS256 family transposase [Spirosoma flavus]